MTKSGYKSLYGYYEYIEEQGVPCALTRES